MAATPALMTETPPHDADRRPAPKASATSALGRRWWLNLGLLVLVAGLGLFAWYRSEHPSKQAKPLLTDINTDTVEQIEIERPHETNVRLERRDGGWRLVAPIEARADAFAADSLLRLLKAPIEGTVEPPADAKLARYGLEQPKLRVRFDTAEIDFGERHPLKDEQYVKYESAVHLISTEYYTQATVPYTNLIDSRLIEPGRKFVSIKLPTFALALKDGTWVRDPEIKSLSSDRINAFVDEWRHARALNIKPHTGKKKPQESVAITFTKPDGRESRLTIDVLARKPELVLYRKDENLEYHFPEDIGKRLLELNEK